MGEETEDHCGSGEQRESAVPCTFWRGTRPKERWLSVVCHGYGPLWRQTCPRHVTEAVKSNRPKEALQRGQWMDNVCGLIVRENAFV